MAHPTLTATSERLTQAVYYGDNLSANVGGGFVPTNRQITTAAPLTGGGDLQANLSLGIGVFAGTDSGVVPAATGTGTKFLRDDASWQTVYPLVDGSKGDITVSNSGETWTIGTGIVSTTKMGSDVTTAGKALLTGATATAQRTTLGLGTAAVYNIPATGDAAAGEVVFGNDSRLDDTRTPKDHTHPQSAIVNLEADLGQKITTDGTARSIFKLNDIAIGTRRGLNFIEGTNITITMADDATNEEVECTIASTGGSVTEPTYGDIAFSTTDTTDDTWTINDDAVTLAKMADATTTARLIGSSESSAVLTEISLGSNISMTGTTINVSSGTASIGNGTYSDVVVSGDPEGTVWTIATGVVNTTKMGDDVTTAGKALLTGANAAAQRTTLGLAIGTDVQAYDAELAAIAGLTSAADKTPYFTGSGTAALATLTAFGRQLIGAADQSATQALLALRVGTEVQGYDADLAALAGLTSAADKLPYFTGSGTASVATFTAAARTLVAEATATGQRSVLGLGSVATLSEDTVRSIPQNAQTGTYTLQASDNGKHIYLSSPATTGVTVPASIFSVGHAVTVVNNSSGTATITQGAGATVRRAGTADTGSRTLAQYGIATILCVAADTFILSGSGVS